MLSQEGVRLPGQRRFDVRTKNKAQGVNLADNLYEDLCKRAGR